jgi:hypothetical protein
MAGISVLFAGLLIIVSVMCLSLGWSALLYSRFKNVLLSLVLFLGFLFAVVHQYLVTFFALVVCHSNARLLYWALFLITTLALMWAGRLEIKRLLNKLHLLLCNSPRCENFFSRRRVFKYVIPVFVIVCFLLYAWIFPPTGFDDYVYHLPFSEMIVQRQCLGFFPFPERQIYAETYPKFVELLVASGGLALGSFYAVSLWNMFAVFGLGLGTFAVSRFFGGGRRLAFNGAILALSTPVVLMLGTTVKTDLYFALASFGGVIFASVCVASPKNDEDSAIFGWIGLLVSCGLMLGVKPNGLANAPLIVLSAVCGRRWVQGHWQMRQTLHYWVKLWPLVALMGLIGGFWYSRNFLHYGNPVYPIQLHIPFIGDLPGTLSMSAFYDLGEFERYPLALKWLHNWFELKGWAGVFYIHDGRFSGLGPLWVIFFLPALIFGILKARRERNLAFAFFLLVGALTFFATPMNWYPRYSLGVVFFGAVAWIEARNSGILLGWERALSKWSWVLACYSFLAVLPNTFFTHLLMWKQVKSLSKPLPAILSFKLNDLKREISTLSVSHTGPLRIGFDTQSFYSALRPWQDVAHLEYLDIEEEGGFDHIFQRKLDLVHVVQGTPFHKWLQARPLQFRKRMETMDSPLGVLYEVIESNNL